jgi:hypothetical protein
MESAEKQNSDFLFEGEGLQSLPDNLIANTRNFAKQFGELERLQVASYHVDNALQYKEPRFDIINSNEPRFYKQVYRLQTSRLWEALLSGLSFLHMYLIVF